MKSKRKQKQQFITALEINKVKFNAVPISWKF